MQGISVRLRDAIWVERIRLGQRQLGFHEGGFLIGKL